MSAYCVLDDLGVIDVVAFEEYKRRVAPLIHSFGGRYLVVGGNPSAVEGDWTPTALVIIEFANMDAVRRWYDSEEYRELKQLRRAALWANLVFVEGVS